MRTLRLVGAALLACLLALSGSVASAQTAPPTFTLQPGGKATILFEAFCTEFGDKFPAAITLPNSVGPDGLRAALSYAENKGLTRTQQSALQVQYALWQVLGQTNAPKGDATTQDVIANGTTVPPNPQATSLLDAAKANQVKLTLNSWQPIGGKAQITATASDNFYGRGQVTVENTSQQALTLYMPVATIFPASQQNEQDMAAYATNIQVSNPQLPATSAGATLPLVAFGLLLAAGAIHFTRRAAALPQ